MELNFSSINIPEPIKSIREFLKDKKNPYLIEMIDYGLSLLKPEDFDLKMDLIARLIKMDKKMTQLIEEFGKSSSLLRSIYDLISVGFITQKNYSSGIPGIYLDNILRFDLKKLRYKLQKDLIDKKTVLEQEKMILEDKLLFICDKCEKTYDYIEAISINFACCNGFIIELNNDTIINEINQKIQKINAKLKILDKIK
ncbi:MAG: hypothetical protein ACTSPY_00795 [Candidatus Helarchaeota archaeon]